MDGRHARRERGQRAVINAMFELLQEGRLSPSVEEVGARAGVSVATIFRNHGNVDELARHAVALFEERFGKLFQIPQIGEGSLGERIACFCDARLDLYETIWPYVRFMTVRSVKHPEAAENLDRVREVLANQVRRQFEAELSSVGHAGSLDLAATIDALTSPESWSLMQSPHSRTRRQIKRAWRKALTGLFVAGT
jgi:AcrR family transcriptional regulator